MGSLLIITVSDGLILLSCGSTGLAPLDGVDRSFSFSFLAVSLAPRET